MRNKTYVCFDCRKTARNTYGRPKCTCGLLMQCLYWFQRVPKQRDNDAWDKLHDKWWAYYRSKSRTQEKSTAKFGRRK